MCDRKRKQITLRFEQSEFEKIVSYCKSNGIDVDSNEDFKSFLKGVITTFLQTGYNTSKIEFMISEILGEEKTKIANQKYIAKNFGVDQKY